MPAQPLAPEKLREAIEAYHAAGKNMTEAAKALGVNESTLRHRVTVAQSAGFFVATKVPDGNVPIEELIERLSTDFERKEAEALGRHLIHIDMAEDIAQGILAFGDPHLGSPLTDWPALKRDIALVKKTKGLFATNIGDTGDNWSGKLAGLWAQSSVSHHNEHRLAEWFLREIAPKCLVWIMGNHDAWTGAGSLLSWLVGHHGVIEGDWSQRIALRFPGGRTIRVGTYHGLQGHSFWNPGHGGLRQARLGPRDHLIFAGHTHKSMILTPAAVDPDTLEWSIVVQLGSYKRLPNHYGNRLGGSELNAFPSAVAIFNPQAKKPSSLVRIYTDPEDGADVLGWMRKRQASAKTAEIPGT